MNWYKISKMLTYLDHKKFASIILDNATYYFAEIIKKGAGDPLPSSEAVIKNPTFFSKRLGLTEENAIEMIEKFVNDYNLNYSGDAISISWEKLPQRYKQKSRTYSKQ